MRAQMFQNTCYTTSGGSSSGTPCVTIDDYYDLPILYMNVRFHFVKDQYGNNFTCTSESEMSDNHFGYNVAQQIIQASNALLSNVPVHTLLY